MRMKMLWVVTALLLVTCVPAMAQKSAKKSTAKTGAAKSNEAQVRDVYERWKKAFEARDLDGIMALYAPGDQTVAYDIVPPLQYVGKDAYRKDYEDFLKMFSGPLTIEFADERVVAGNDVAFVNTLEHLTGIQTNGQKMDMWIRGTSGLKKINGKWLIMHDHISVPADFDTGKAVMDLKP